MSDYDDTRQHEISVSERILNPNSKLGLDEYPLLKEDDMKQKLLDFVIKHWNVIHHKNGRIPIARKSINLRMETRDTPPINPKYWPLNPFICTKKIKDLNRLGIISKSSSPW